MSLALRNLLFTIVVPGLGGAYVPWLIITRHGGRPSPVPWYAVAIIIGGLLLYFSCQWFFGSVGRGTPALWDAPKRFVRGTWIAGPYSAHLDE